MEKIGSIQAPPGAVRRPDKLRSFFAASATGPDCFDMVCIARAPNAWLEREDRVLGCDAIVHIVPPRLQRLGSLPGKFVIPQPQTDEMASGKSQLAISRSVMKQM